jgi:hypothetical protein
MGGDCLVAGWLVGCLWGRKLLPGWLAGGFIGWLAAKLALLPLVAAVCVFASLRTKTFRVMLEIRGNMGQCKSEDQDFKRD